MKFLFVAPRFHTNQYVVTKSLIGLGHSVAFFAYYMGRTEDHSSVEPDLLAESLLTRWQAGVFKKKYGANLAESKKIKYFIPKFSDLYKKIKAYAPDIVITRETNMTSMYVSLICRILGIKAVIVYNQIPFFSRKKTGFINRIKSAVKKLCFPRVRITTVCTDNPSKFNKNREQYYIKPHDYFIPFAAEVKETERAYCSGGIIRILSVGKYRDYKNHFLLVDAVSLLKDTRNLRVSIAGQAYNDEEMAYYDKLNGYIRDKGLADIIKLYKNILYSEMDKLYTDHDIFTLTSKKELASIAVLEAMANGMVTISTDANGTASYIEEGTCGYVFRTMDPEDLAAKIELLVSRKNDIESMGRAACKNIMEHYSFKNYYIALGELLKREFTVDLA